ncbi:MAG: type II toxin-antitoxin system PemK/MazF family toxin [Candidatus Gracilibacteria bacterium]
MEKQFQEWIYIKRTLHEKVILPPYVRKGEIWWTSIGENVGHEINGKSKLFSRPVLIFKKLSRSLFLVIPLTTKVKYGTWFVGYRQSSVQGFACLHQVRTVDYRRLSTKLGEIDDSDFKRIKSRFLELYS